MSGIGGFDSSLLMSYFSSRLSTPTSLRMPQTTGGLAGAAAGITTPWDSASKVSTEAQDSRALSDTRFLDLSDSVLRTQARTDDARADQDIQKLFALYKGLDRLSYLAGMATRDSTGAGQLPGLNERFQNGLGEIQGFLSTATFNNFALLAGDKVSSVVSSAVVPQSATSYTGGIVARGKALFDPVANLSASDSFTISVTKGGVTTDIAIDLSQVSGPLTLDNIVSYVNGELEAGGFATRLRRVMISDEGPAKAAAAAKIAKPGDPAPALVDPITYETFGLQLRTSGTEKVSLSAASAAPALYLAGSTGNAEDREGQFTKLIDLTGTPRGEFANPIAPDDGTAAAQSTVVDAQGNAYVLGTTEGSMGGQLAKGTSDAFLTKYDSAGNKLWTRLVGSSDTAQGFSLALDPTGGVVIAGTTTSALSQTAIGGGKDAFVAKYASDGTRKWLRQVSPLSTDQAFAVSVDSTGNVFVGGQVSGTLAAGQTNNGGGDATITRLSASGQLVYRRQFGTSGADQVSQVATTSDGGLVVASVQDGHAIVAKYAAGDATVAALWQVDLGDLRSGGTIGGIAIDGSAIYLSGTTSNATLDAGGDAAIVHASSGNTDAYVFRIDDAGASATANFVSYVGTAASDKGAAIAASGGKLYLTGTTRSALPGQTQSFANADNLFVTQLDQDGSIGWSKQFGGIDGLSQGAGIAVDAQGASVLDALGLPRGNLQLSQSVYLTDQTTVRAGDSFKFRITALNTSEATIRIDADETMQSLATKINVWLGNKGKASVTYNANGASLKIAANAGVELKLSAGPANQNALAGLGISPGLVVKDADKNTRISSSAPKQLPVYGLSMPKTLDLSTIDGARRARADMLAVTSALRTAYRKITTPRNDPFTNTQSGRPVPAYLTSQLGTYQAALAQLQSLTGTTA